LRYRRAIPLARGSKHAHSRGCTAQRIQYRARTADRRQRVFGFQRQYGREICRHSGGGGINGIDALLALQGVEDATERRRRFAKRGSKALDMLDSLKVQIIEGRIDLATLTRLESALNELTERSGEDQLDAIGLRVAVEIAKRRPRLATAQ
jgi:Class II flagellar assembly regulator